MRVQFSLSIVTRVDHFRAVEGVSAAARDAGGWVDDVNFFSNIVAVLRIDLPSNAVPLFIANLLGADLRPYPEILQILARHAKTIGADEDLTCSIRMTFVHDEPDQRRLVPSVPGSLAEQGGDCDPRPFSWTTR